MIFEPANLLTRVECVPATACADAVDVTVSGPLVLRTRPLLHAVLNAALEAGARHVAVDLHDVTDLDTAGLATLVTTARRLRACNGSLAFIAVSPECEAVMDRLHLFSAERVANGVATVSVG